MPPKLEVNSSRLSPIIGGVEPCMVQPVPLGLNGEAGETVVTEGQLRLAPGSKVQFREGGGDRRKKG